MKLEITLKEHKFIYEKEQNGLFTFYLYEHYASLGNYKLICKEVNYTYEAVIYEIQDLIKDKKK